MKKETTLIENNSSVHSFPEKLRFFSTTPQKFEILLKKIKTKRRKADTKKTNNKKNFQLKSSVKM
jgi:hypothetical protein